MRSLARTALSSVALVALASAACSDDGGSAERHGSVTEATSQCPTPTPPEGVDISDGQGAIDWASTKAAGVTWTIMKATQGTYNVQSRFAADWSGAKAAGVARGAYHFFDPTEDGTAQAAAFLKIVGPLDAEDLAPALDVECPDGDPMCLGFSGGSGTAAPADIHARVVAWIAAVEAATGRKPILYTFEDYFVGSAIPTTGLDADPLWIAALSTSNGCIAVPAPWTAAALWQYGTGTVAGITPIADRDRALGFLDELRGWPEAKRTSRADVDGDGRADVCGRGASGLTCALSSGAAFGAPFAGPAWSDAMDWRAPSRALTLRFGDLDGDGRADVCGRGASGITCALSTGSGFGAPFLGPAWSDAAGWDDPAAYRTLDLADVDGDGRADVCGRSASGITCALSKGSGFGAPFPGPTWSDAAGWATAERYETIRFADIDGDGRADACGRSSDGIHCALSQGAAFGPDIQGPAWSDAAGWSAAAHAATIQLADIDGDGRADVCGRSKDGLLCALASGTGFGAAFPGPAWSDASGFASPSSYATITFLDLDGDGRDDVCARAADGVHCALSLGTAFGPLFAGPAWSDAAGWDEPRYYATIHAGDVNGDRKDDLCARASSGIVCAPSTGGGFGAAVTGPAWSDAAWGVAPYWETAVVVGRAHPGAPAPDAGAAEDGGAGDDAGGQAATDAGPGGASSGARGASGCGCRAAGGERLPGAPKACLMMGVALAFARRGARRRVRGGAV